MHPFEALYLGSGKVLVDPGSPCATPPHYCRQGGYWSTVAGVLWSGSHPAVVVCRGGSRGDGGEEGETGRASLFTTDPTPLTNTHT